jgi:hypothetical protein
MPLPALPARVEGDKIKMAHARIRATFEPSLLAQCLLPRAIANCPCNSAGARFYRTVRLASAGYRGDQGHAADR